MNNRNLILGAVAVVIFAIAIGYYFTRSGAQAEIPTEIRSNCACLACKQHVRVAASIRDVQPYTCPDCGERAAYPLYLCQDCGKYHVPNLIAGEEGELPGLPMVPSCLACGSGKVTPYAGAETIPADDLILPPWPQ